MELASEYAYGVLLIFFFIKVHLRFIKAESSLGF